MDGMAVGAGVGIGIEYAAVNAETVLICVAIVAGGVCSATVHTVAVYDSV